LRTLFALTIALGVSTPTLTTTNANGVTINDIAPGLHAIEPAHLSKPLGKIAIDGYDTALRGSDELLSAARGQRAEKPVAVKVEQPAVEKIDEAAVDEAAIEDDDLPVTVDVERVCEALADAANAHGLPVGFFARLIWQESKFDQWARSPVGALGVAQFMPPTAKEYGLHDPFDPIQSVSASARFLRQLRDQFGNLGLAAAAYNAGGGRIRKWLNGQSAMPEETRNYVSVITGHPPKSWTVQKSLAVSFALPKRAPCEGVEGLSRSAGITHHDVRLTEMSVELIEEAEAARRAKIAAAKAARNKRYAAAKTTKGGKLAAAKVTVKAGRKVRVAEAGS
jgi:hypothetical protein